MTYVSVMKPLQCVLWRLVELEVLADRNLSDNR